MISFIIGLLLILWVLGLLVKIGGGIIHLLLLAAIVLFVYDWLVGRRGRKTPVE